MEFDHAVPQNDAKGARSDHAVIYKYEDCSRFQ